MSPQPLTVGESQAALAVELAFEDPCRVGEPVLGEGGELGIEPRRAGKAWPTAIAVCHRPCPPCCAASFCRGPAARLPRTSAPRCHLAGSLPSGRLPSPTADPAIMPRIPASGRGGCRARTVTFGPLPAGSQRLHGSRGQRMSRAEPLRIVVTNDDGIDRAGLRLLATAALRTGGKALVAAPDHRASGSSAAVSAVRDDGRIVMERTKLAALARGQRGRCPGSPLNEGARTLLHAAGRAGRRTRDHRTGTRQRS